MLDCASDPPARPPNASAPAKPARPTADEVTEANEVIEAMRAADPPLLAPTARGGGRSPDRRRRARTLLGECCSRWPCARSSVCAAAPPVLAWRVRASLGSPAGEAAEPLRPAPAFSVAGSPPPPRPLRKGSAACSERALWEAGGRVREAARPRPGAGSAAAFALRRRVQRRPTCAFLPAGVRGRAGMLRCWEWPAAPWPCWPPAASDWSLGEGRERHGSERESSCCAGGRNPRAALTMHARRPLVAGSLC